MNKYAKNNIERFVDFLLEETDRELDEFNAVGTGAVVGYTLPLGMKPDYDKLGTGKSKRKRKSKKRWYHIREASKNEYRKNKKKNYYKPLVDKSSLDEEYIGKKNGVRYYQMGGSLPDNLYNRDEDGKPTRDPGVPGLKK